MRTLRHVDRHASCMQVHEVAHDGREVVLFFEPAQSSLPAPAGSTAASRPALSADLAALTLQLASEQVPCAAASTCIKTFNFARLEFSRMHGGMKADRAADHLTNGCAGCQCPVAGAGWQHWQPTARAGVPARSGQQRAGPGAQHPVHHLQLSGSCGVQVYPHVLQDANKCIISQSCVQLDRVPC